MGRLINKNNGQGLIELILAMAIFSIIVPGMAVLALGSFNSLEQGGEQAEAMALAQEGWEAVRSIRDRAWNENIYQQSGVHVNGSQWDFLGEASVETNGDYTRTITYVDVCRDATDEIVECPGNYTDVHSKKVNVVVEWTTGLGKVNQVDYSGYLTNWNSNDWVEDIGSEFEDGSHTQTEVTTSLGNGDGAVTLERMN